MLPISLLGVRWSAEGPLRTWPDSFGALFTHGPDELVVITIAARTMNLIEGAIRLGTEKPIWNFHPRSPNDEFGEN